MVLSKDLKIAICFGLIMGALISVCNMCFAAENIEYSVISGVAVDHASDFFVSSSSNLGYIEIEPGYLYSVSVSSPSGDRWAAFSDSIAVAGEPCFDRRIIARDSSFSFSYSDYSYLYFNINSNAYVTITREPLQGMTSFVDNMAYSLSIGDLSQVWVLVVPIIAISVLLGLGFYLLKRLLNRIKRAKGGV